MTSRCFLFCTGTQQRKHGPAGREYAHTSSKPLPIHKVLSAAFSLSGRIPAPTELLRIFPRRRGKTHFPYCEPVRDALTYLKATLF